MQPCCVRWMGHRGTASWLPEFKLLQAPKHAYGTLFRYTGAATSLLLDGQTVVEAIDVVVKAADDSATVSEEIFQDEKLSEILIPSIKKVLKNFYSGNFMGQQSDHQRWVRANIYLPHWVLSHLQNLSIVDASDEEEISAVLNKYANVVTLKDDDKSGKDILVVKSAVADDGDDNDSIPYSSKETFRILSRAAGDMQIVESQLIAARQYVLDERHGFSTSKAQGVEEVSDAERFIAVKAKLLSLPTGFDISSSKGLVLHEDDMKKKYVSPTSSSGNIAINDQPYLLPRCARWLLIACTWITKKIWPKQNQV